MNPERARRRRIRRRILFGVGGLLILAAALVGGLGLLFPWVLAHPEKVQSFLSERLRRPVAFAKLDGEWLPGGPLFRLSGLRIGGDRGHPELMLERAELAFDFYAPFKRGVAWHELRILGLAIDAERDTEGRFRIVQWRGSADAEGDPLDALRSLGAFRIGDSSLTFHDVASDSRVHLSGIDLAVSPGRAGRVIVGRARLGDSAPIGVRCDLAGDFRAGKCFLRAQELDVGKALGDLRVAGIGFIGGQADLSFWASFRERQIESGRIEFSAESLAMRGLQPVRLANGEQIEARYSPDSTQLAMSWTRANGTEQFALLEGPSLDETDPARSKLSLTRSFSNGAWTLEIEHLALDRLAPWFSLSTLVSPGTAGWLFEASPSGDLRNLRMIGRDRDIDDVQGRLEAVALSPTRHSPRVSGIHARIRGDGAAVALRIAPVETVIDFPGVFPAPFPVLIERAELVLAREEGGVRVEFPELAMQGEDFGLEGWLALTFEREGRRPFMEGTVEVRDSKVVAAKAFWPIIVMPRNTRAWLDRALISGRIRSGIASIHGDLDDWPFNANQGRFQADAKIEDLVLDYHADWPRGQARFVEARFLNGGMSARLRDGRVLDVHVEEVAGEIERFRDPILHLSGRGQGSGTALLGFLRATPMKRPDRDELLALSIGGHGNAEFDLQLPLAARLGEPAFSGQVELHDADLIDARRNISLEQANGIVRFSRDGFDAEGLDVRVGGDAARFAIAFGGHVASDDNVLEAELRGNLKAEALLEPFPAFDAYRKRLPGMANIELSYAQPRSPDPEHSLPARLTVRSDLRGIALDLPAPLGKDAESPMPLQMSLGIPTAGQRLELQLGEMARLSARLASESEDFAAHLALGGELPVMPKRAGLRVSGKVPSFDLSGWSSVFVNGGGLGPQLDVDVQAAELDVIGRGFAETRLRIERDDKAMHVVLKGLGIDGGFDVPRADVALRGLTLQFEKLHWPAAEVRTAAVAQVSDPALLPPLHIWVRDLKLGSASFGEARIETQPMQGGLHIEQFDARSPTLTLRAQGDWKLVEGIERSSLDITLSSESLGGMLESLGYSGVIDGGQTVAHIAGSWTGSPAQFGLANIDGTLSGEVGEGRILNVDPGAGRLFGLVNFSAIPRRLSLDFRDFFQSGMAFDSIQGNFKLANGSAHTEDLEIKGPAADIRIRGRAGLRDRDYDQEMEVTPKLRSALPIVGAVAAGPVGAVVGVLAQEVMRKPLDEVVSSRYRVRGTWDKPDISLIGKHRRSERAQDAADSE